MAKIEPLNQFQSINIDFPFVQVGNTENGILATSIDTIKPMIDRAIVLGFDTIAFDTNVPINAQTGDLQFSVAESDNGDKTFPADIWKGIQYAESKGLRTILDLNVRNVLNDVAITTDNVGTKFNSQILFNSINQYETEIATKANFYGVDGIRIAQFNFGFDREAYSSEWQKVISSIREVYSGSIGYQGSVEDLNTPLYKLVDEIQVSYSPGLKLQSQYTTMDIVPLYFEPYVMGNKQLSSTSLFSRLENLSQKYPDKKISLELTFQPGQSAGNEDADLWSYVFDYNPLLENAKDQSKLYPYPENLIDTKLNQQKIYGFFEYFGNYLKNIADGIQIYQYTPWAEAEWIKNPNPNNITGQVWNSVMRAGLYLNYNPEAETALAAYLQKNWGFTKIHYGSEKDDQVSGSEVNDTFIISQGNDFLTGDLGIDQLITGDLYSTFRLRKEGSNWILEGTKTSNKNLGIYTLKEIERISFNDTSVALDLNENAGKTTKILGAVFGKSAVANKQYVGVGLDLLDKGMSYDTLAGLALNAANVTTNDQIVTTLWTNVVGLVPSAADKAPYIKMLEDGMTPGALVHLAADTSLNTTNINLVGLAQTGIEYTPIV